MKGKRPVWLVYVNLLLAFCGAGMIMTRMLLLLFSMYVARARGDSPRSPFIKNNNAAWHQPNSCFRHFCRQPSIGVYKRYIISYLLIRASLVHCWNGKKSLTTWEKEARGVPVFFGGSINFRWRRYLCGRSVEDVAQPNRRSRSQRHAQTSPPISGHGQKHGARIAEPLYFCGARA